MRFHPKPSLPHSCDVLVVGGGNAGFPAAVASAQAGAKKVIIVDKCPEDWAGGNSYFTAGAMRIVHNGVSDLLSVVNNCDDATSSNPKQSPSQIYDSRATPRLRDEEYRDAVVEKPRGSTIEDLADRCCGKGLRNRTAFLQTFTEYNAAVYKHRDENPNMEWDPAIKDGLSTQSSSSRPAIAKSNWALPIDKPPFIAVKVTSGVKFTFGGLAVNPETAAVISSASMTEVPGPFCAGEMLGGLFYRN